MSNTMRPSKKLTIVEEGTEFKGTLMSSCPIDVRGKVEGELETPALTVSASGAVHGRAKVGEVSSQGEISGEFDADRIELAGVVRDNTVIRARSLDVKLAAGRGKLQIIFGECELSVGDEPTEADRVAEPAAEASAPAPAELVPPMAAAAVPEGLSAEPAALVGDGAAVPEEGAAADGEAEDEAAEAEAGEAGDAAGGKRKRRKKNGHEEAASGWSQPPSQPPPAN